jgi:hypothetical protein
MKTKAALLMALAILVSVCAGNAQNTPTTPVAGGPMCQMTPEQRTARQQQMAATVEQMRQKKAAGTLTDTEKVWLDRMEQAGGLCVNGTPRGRCGMGMGWRNGLRNGTGPRAQLGACPQAGSSAVSVPAGQANGKGCAMNTGQGQGAGMGLRNGTGPRSANGTCPLQNPAPAN